MKSPKPLPGQAWKDRCRPVGCAVKIVDIKKPYRSILVRFIYSDDVMSDDSCIEHKELAQFKREFETSK